MSALAVGAAAGEPIIAAPKQFVSPGSANRRYIARSPNGGDHAQRSRHADEGW